MSDPFQGWLDLQPLVKDTQFGSNDKWDSLTPARDIKKLVDNFVIPSFVLQNILVSPTSYICAQFNFTLPQRFVLQPIKPGYPAGLTLCYFCIRFRIGTNVFRYQLSNTSNSNFPLNFAAEYVGQVIESNFCIEVWTKIGVGYTMQTVSNPTNLTVNTSILTVPNDEFTVAPQYLPLQVVPRSTLFNPLPSANPAIFDPSGPWLSN